MNYTTYIENRDISVFQMNSLSNDTFLICHNEKAEIDIAVITKQQRFYCWL